MPTRRSPRPWRYRLVDLPDIGADDIAWACETTSGSPVGGAVLAAISEAADDERRRLDRKRSLYERKIEELSDKLSQTRDKLSEALDKRAEWRRKEAMWREKIAARRADLAEARAVLHEERQRRQRLRAILADLFQWVRRVTHLGPTRPSS